MVTRLALLGAGRIGKVHAKAIAEDKRAKLEADLIAAFRADMLDALMNDPQRLMRTGLGGKKRMYTAASILNDNLGEVETHRLIKLLADAARGEDVALRAAVLLSSVAKEYGEYHGADAAEEA